MQIDPQLAEAFVHRSHTVMLRRLRPLSLRRLFALMIAESPFLDSARDATWGDLETAVTICALRNPVSVMARLHRHRTLRGRLLRVLQPGALEDHGLRFVAYLRDYHSLPESAEEEGAEKAKAPWILRIVETLRRNGYRKRWFHLWHDPAWDMATGEAFFKYATIQELDGADLNVLDDDEKALLEMARTAREAKERAEKEKSTAAGPEKVDEAVRG